MKLNSIYQINALIDINEIVIQHTDNMLIIKKA